MPFFATYDTTVINVEPETERKGDSCASAINVTAGVDVSHSGQGNEASELDGDRRECVFCFGSFKCVFCFASCETCVRQQWLGHGQDAHKRNSRIRKKLYRKCRSMINMRGAWRLPLYVRKKETAMCRDHIDGTVEHVLREIMSECVLKLEGSIPIHPTLHTSDTGGGKGRRRFLFRFCYCVSASFAQPMSIYVLTNTCVAIYT